jgi:allantoinase
VIVRGGDVVTPAGITTADIVVDGGRIAALVPAGTAPRDNQTLDATGLLIFPGMVDCHVHFDEPGRTGWEGFDTGSAAAVAGGVTTVVDMPIDCDPPTITAAAVAAKAAAVAGSSRVDVAMWGGLVPSSVGALGEMLEAGVVGFKAFGCPSGWDDFPAADTATLAAGMAVAAAEGVPVAVHCELASQGHTVASEVAAVRWAAGLAHAAGARLHVVHCSAVEAVDEARRWPGVTVETCPHYLVLDDSSADPRARCFPPIRSAGNRDQLWERVAGGMVDCVASDHSPCPPELREGPEPWGGIDGVGMVLPLLLSSGRLAIEEIVSLTTAAARILRLPGKGAIAPGYDADLAIVDPGAAWTVTSDTVRTRHKASPYVGMTLKSRIVATVVRGRVVFDDGGVGAPGGGRMVRPTGG